MHPVCLRELDGISCQADFHVGNLFIAHDIVKRDGIDDFAVRFEGLRKQVRVLIRLITNVRKALRSICVISAGQRTLQPSPCVPRPGSSCPESPQMATAADAGETYGRAVLGIIMLGMGTTIGQGFPALSIMSFTTSDARTASRICPPDQFEREYRANHPDNRLTTVEKRLLGLSRIGPAPKVFTTTKCLI